MIRMVDAGRDPGRDSGPDCVSWRITVVRTGGFAGLRREWSVRSLDDSAVDWDRLIAACPWNASTGVGAARDHFVWRIEVNPEARSAARERTAVLPDPKLTGPWRLLVDQVRETYKRARIG
jgi:hypothetical protein